MSLGSICPPRESAPKNIGLVDKAGSQNQRMPKTLGNQTKSKAREKKNLNVLVHPPLPQLTRSQAVAAATLSSGYPPSLSFYSSISLSKYC